MPPRNTEDPRTRQGFNGAGAEEPPVAGSAGTGGLADAIDSATKAEGELAQATQKRQRLNLNDPAVIAAKAADDATRALIESEVRLTRTIEARQKAQSGLSTGGSGVSRRNDLLDEAFGVSRSDPHRPVSERIGRAERFREVDEPRPAKGADARPGDAGTDSKMAEALRSERELFTAMRERLGLARTLAGQSTTPAGGVGPAGVVAKGYGGPAAVGGERFGATGPVAAREEQFRTTAERLGTARRLDISDTRASNGGGLSIHDERRAVLDRQAAASRKEQFVEQLEAKRGESQPGVMGRFAGGIRANPLAALQQVASFAGRLSDAANTPYQTSRDRGIAMIESAPVVGDAIGALGRFRQDLQNFGGRRRGEEAVTDTAAETDLKVGALPDWVRRMHERGVATYTRDQLDRRAGTIREPLADPRRTGVAERQRYDEQLRHLPVADRLSDATTEMQKATAKGRAYREMESILRKRKDLDLFEEEQRVDKRLAGANGDAEVIATGRAQKLSIARRKVAFEDEIYKLHEGMEANDLDKVRIRRSITSANIERAGVGLDLAREREGTARGQAQRLGMMGVDGRMEAILAKQIVDQIGFENAPQALIGTYSAAFPETAAAESQKAGQQLQPQFQQLAPEEYRDTVGDAERRANEAMNELRRMQDESVRHEYQMLADVLQELPDIMFGKRLEIMRSMLEQLMREGELKGRR